MTKKNRGILLLTLMAALLGITSVPVLKEAVTSMDSFSVMNIGVSFLGCLIDLSIYLTFILSDEDGDEISSLRFRHLLVTEFFALHTGMIHYYLEGRADYAFFNLLETAICYGCGSLETYTLWCFVVKDKQKKSWKGKVISGSMLMATLILLNILSLILNFFLGFFFSVGEDGRIISSRFSYLLSVSFPALILLGTGFSVERGNSSKEEKRDFLSFVFFSLLGIAAGILSGGITLPYIFALFVEILVYTYFFSNRGLELLEAQEKSKEKELELKMQEQNILLSQIQPHFVFNTLSVIAHLCRKDSSLAYSTTVDFADYLRHNLESISSSPMVPFCKELDHIRKYVNIQKVRFGEDLTVTYDIGPEDFSIPSLSVLPLVENAIVHGILHGKKEKGTVTVSTREDAASYVVLVKDNGIGFDEKRIEEDGRLHVGLANSRKRIEELAKGTLVVSSVQGTGTTVIIRLGKGGNV